MCEVLSVCVTKEDARVLAYPGVHHHSELMQRAVARGDLDAGRRGQDVVGLEMNVRERIVVVDESVLPDWYRADVHDDALWEWMWNELHTVEGYVRWMERELSAPRPHAGAYRHDLDMVLAPTGFRTRTAEEKTVDMLVRSEADGALPERAVLAGRTAPRVAPRDPRAVADDLAERATEWAKPWTDESVWSVSYSPDDLDRARRAPDALSPVPADLDRELEALTGGAV